MTINVHRVLVLVVLLALVAACGSRSEDSQNTRNLTATPAIETRAPQNTTPSPANPASEPQELTLEAVGFTQQDTTLTYVITVRNPNAAFLVESGNYEITVYDTEGRVLTTTLGTFQLIFPNQRYAHVGSLNLDRASMLVARIRIDLRPGSYIAAAVVPDFITTEITYRPGEATVVGMLTNPFPTAVDGVIVTAVAYDAAGIIIGGGDRFLHFMPAGETLPVIIPVITQVKPATIEFFASLLAAPDPTPNPLGLQPVLLIAQGYGQDDKPLPEELMRNDHPLGYGLIVKNPNPNHAFENVPYHVIVYAEDGRVLLFHEAFLRVLLPNEETGEGGILYPPNDVTVGRVVIRVHSGKPTRSSRVSPFTIEGAIFRPEERDAPEVTGDVMAVPLGGMYGDKVTGVVTSSSRNDVRVWMSALSFDAHGTIIGGGYVLIDPVPAGGQVSVTVPVVTSGTPAMVQIYATAPDLLSIHR